MLSVKQIARRLNISTDAVCDLIRTGALAAHRVGRQYRVEPVAFKAYLSASRVPTNATTPAGAASTAGV